MTVILNCLQIFFSGFSYLTAVFLMLFGFGCLFRLFGVSERRVFRRR